MLLDPNIIIVRNNEVEALTKRQYIKNGIEGVILDVLETPMTMQQLVAQLMHIYDVDRQTCLSETSEFVEELIATQMITVK